MSIRPIVLYVSLHIPTNIVVACQNERSQIKTATAMRLLRHEYGSIIRKLKTENVNQSLQKRKDRVGSQIRSYVLHPIIWEGPPD